MIISKAEMTALTGMSISKSKAEKQRLERERLRETRNLVKHVNLLREKPKLSLTQLRERAEDLNRYLVLIAEFNEYYDTRLVMRDYPEAKMYFPPQSEKGVSERAQQCGPVARCTVPEFHISCQRF